MSSPPSELHGSLVLPVSLDVLVAEDDEDARFGLVRAIRDLGHRCRAAADGETALRMHERSPADVILSDWQMPRVNGLDLCRRVRANDRAAGYTYFIFMTAFADKSRFLEAMHAGADDFLTKPIDLEELEARLGSARRVTSAYRRLAERNAALRRDSQVFYRAARVDPLTGVPNRLQMQEDLARVESDASRGRRYCAALCDLDFFKQYNDREGHLAGDQALCAVARTIREQMRRGDTVYRYGGEEFLVILPDQGLEEASAAMERVRGAVERLGMPHPASDAAPVLTISVGLAELEPERAPKIADWLAHADAALYRAKGHGRNRIERTAA